MNTYYRKFFLTVLIAALTISALPFASASAAGSSDTATPSAPVQKQQPLLRDTRLELVFARQQFNIKRVGLLIEGSPVYFTRIQKLIDLAVKNGKDASAVQSAFDAFKLALENAKPYYTQAQSIADTHAGFDALGKVSDLETAKTTVKSLGEALKQYRTTVGPAAKSLHEAVKNFREANPRPTKSPAAP
jgi:hypothetical protein